MDVSGTGRTLSYDGNGNLEFDGSRSFEWNALNDVAAIEIGTIRTEFSYDGLQRRGRIVEKASGVTTNDVGLVWCDSASCEQRGWSSGTSTRRKFSNGEQLATSVRLKVGDHLGSIASVTDGPGGLIAQYEYDASGRRSLEAGTASPTDGFAGYEQGAGDVWQTVYRQYDPNVGRWLSQDPAGFVDGPNLFAYVRNSPIVLSDPFGLSSSGRVVECGPCLLRIDNDPHKGRHAHWVCRNGSRGCVKPDGSGCEGSGPPPTRVRDCLRRERFYLERRPVMSCDQNCRNVLLTIGAIAASALLTCLLKVPVPVPAP